MLCGCDSLPTRDDGRRDTCIPAGQYLRQGQRSQLGHVSCIFTSQPMPAEPCRDAIVRTHLPWLPVFLGFAAVLVASCVQGQKANDTGDPGFPFGPSVDRRAADRVRAGHQADLRSRLRVVPRCARVGRRVFREHLREYDRRPAARRREQLRSSSIARPAAACTATSPATPSPKRPWCSAGWSTTTRSRAAKIH